MLTVPNMPTAKNQPPLLSMPHSISSAICLQPSSSPMKMTSSAKKAKPTPTNSWKQASTSHASATSAPTTTSSSSTPSPTLLQRATPSLSPPPRSSASLQPPLYPNSPSNPRENA